MTTIIVTEKNDTRIKSLVTNIVVTISYERTMDIG